MMDVRLGAVAPVQLANHPDAPQLISRERQLTAKSSAEAQQSSLLRCRNDVRANGSSARGVFALSNVFHPVRLNRSARHSSMSVEINLKIWGRNNG
jgi:hypothetical protein